MSKSSKSKSSKSKSSKSAGAFPRTIREALGALTETRPGLLKLTTQQQAFFLFGYAAGTLGTAGMHHFYPNEVVVWTKEINGLIDKLESPARS